MSAFDEEEEEGGLLGFMRNSDSSEEERNRVVIKYDSYDAVMEEGDTKSFSLALTAKHHSLWAEFIYNASRILADMMLNKNHPHFIDVKGKKCLELGAGAGLPGFIAGICGAKEVVITDYGHDNDLSLVYPIDINVQLLRRHVGDSDQKFYAMGYVWGSPVHPLIYGERYYHPEKSSVDCSDYDKYVSSKALARSQAEDALSAPVADEDKFDVEILADLIFNRSQHERLLWTVKESLKPKDGVCYVTFSHHDPAKRELDLNFFTLARSEPFNFDVTFVLQEQRRSYPFVENDGLDEARGVVHLYILRLP
jgi:nicotinamide N-methyltransferase